MSEMREILGEEGLREEFDKACQRVGLLVMCLFARDAQAQLDLDILDIEGKCYAWIDEACELARELHNPGRNVPAGRKVEALTRDDYRCVMCGATASETRLHVDNIVPVSRGGANDLSNLQTLCAECNLGKGPRLEHEL